MATLTQTPPPPKAPPKKTAASSAPKPQREQHWAERFARSGYFLGAVLFHFILFLIVFTWVVFQPPPPPAGDFVKTYVPSGAPPPPPPQHQETMKVPTLVAPSPNVINLNTPMPSFVVPMPVLNPTQTTDQTLKVSALTPNLDHMAQRITSIMSTETKGWGRDPSNIQDSNGDPHNVVAKFPVYLASYADGDWGCNIHQDSDGQIVGGSLPNLVAKINEWSHGNIKGEMVPTPLDIGSSELLTKMPPFIFFTGHKDFQLTDDEVSNLAKYLEQGGAIWGDNALPGIGSRFDVAFRREMRRVIPDKGKDFQPLPLTHPIFTHSWFSITAVPQGINYYDEPLEHIDLDGKLAIIYSPNDYSDLYFFRILPGDTNGGPWDPSKTSPLFTNRLFAVNAGVFFRNFTLPAALEAQHLGMNIVGHLLVRFDDKLLLAP